MSFPAPSHRGFVEGVHGRAVAGVEGNVRRPALVARADPEVGYPFSRAEAGPALELHLQRIAERPERLRVEALRSVEVADVRGYVVEHQSSLHGPGRAWSKGASASLCGGAPSFCASSSRRNLGQSGSGRLARP